MKGRTVHAAVNGCANCGVIETVTAIRVQARSPASAPWPAVSPVPRWAVSPDGAMAVTALGLLGAVGGAYAGNAIERNVRTTRRYRVSVRMDDGTRRTMYSAATAPAFAVGERCAWLNGTIVAQG